MPDSTIGPNAPPQNSTASARMRDSVGRKTDDASNAATASLMAHVKYMEGQLGAGSVECIPEINMADMTYVTSALPFTITLVNRQTGALIPVANITAGKISVYRLRAGVEDIIETNVQLVKKDGLLEYIIDVAGASFSPGDAVIVKMGNVQSSYTIGTVRNIVIPPKVSIVSDIADIESKIDSMQIDVDTLMDSTADIWDEVEIIKGMLAYYQGTIPSDTGGKLEITDTPDDLDLETINIPDVVISPDATVVAEFSVRSVHNFDTDENYMVGVHQIQMKQQSNGELVYATYAAWLTDPFNMGGPVEEGLRLALNALLGVTIDPLSIITVIVPNTVWRISNGVTIYTLVVNVLDLETYYGTHYAWETCLNLSGYLFTTPAEADGAGSMYIGKIDLRDQIFPGLGYDFQLLAATALDATLTLYEPTMYLKVE